MKNVLVTGGAGFIGANFVHYLLKIEPGSPNRQSGCAHLRRQPGKPKTLTGPIPPHFCGG